MEVLTLNCGSFDAPWGKTACSTSFESSHCDLEPLSGYGHVSTYTHYYTLLKTTHFASYTGQVVVYCEGSCMCSSWSKIGYVSFIQWAVRLFSKFVRWSLALLFPCYGIYWCREWFQLFPGTLKGNGRKLMLVLFMLEI